MPAAGINLLIAGTSHVGKSTLAAVVGQALGRNVVSTDSMARHPGRPWPTVPPHVAEFYAKLSDRSIYQFLLNHHENMWPHIKKRLLENEVSRNPMVLEGSALRPEYLATLTVPQNVGICLFADADFLRDRMYRESAYGERPAEHQLLIDKFLDRSITDNAANRRNAEAMGIKCVDVTDGIAEARDWLISQGQDRTE